LRELLEAKATNPGSVLRRPLRETHFPEVETTMLAIVLGLETSRGR
jgi:hypothetical protein